MTVGLSTGDHDRMAEVQRLARDAEAGVPSLIALLGEPSWAVRRAVVGALARVGTPAVRALCEALRERGNEARLAATVDALVASGGAVEPELLALAHSSTDPAVLCDVAQILGRRKSAEAIGLLARWSKHEDDNVAVAAIEALGRVGGPAVVEPLAFAVSSGSFFRTFPAISMLGQSGDARGVAPLAALLDQPVYTGEAALALGRIGHVSAVAPLARLLGNPSDLVVRTAASALCELRHRHVAQFGDQQTVLDAFAAAAPPNAAERAAAAFRSAPRAEQVALACVLGWMKDAAAVSRLVELLEADPSIAAAALDALRSMGGTAEPILRAAVRSGTSERRLALLPLLGAWKTAVPDLLPCLEDDDPAVRALACEALGRAGDASAVSALFELLVDPDASVVQAASGAIQSLGSEQTRDLALATARSENVRARRAALRIVSYFAYPEGLPVLLAAIRDPEERVRDAATLGLALIDSPDATAALLEATRHPSAMTRAAACRALANAVNTVEVRGALAQALGDADAWVRYYACQSIGRLHAAELTADVAERIDDPAGQVRVAAVESLAKLGGPRALEALGAASHVEDLDVRRAALLGLGQLRRPEAAVRLRTAAESEDPETRIVALAALVQANAPDVDATLMRAGSGIEPRVRAGAIALLGERGAAATAWLIDHLGRDEDREATISALAQPADGRIETMLTALETADRTTAGYIVRALLRSRRPNANAAVEAALQLQNVHARRAAAAGLASLGTSAARAALALAAAADGDDEVRRIAATSA